MVLSRESEAGLDGEDQERTYGDWGETLIGAVGLGLLLFSWTAILGSLSVLIQLALLALLIYLKPLTIAAAVRRCWPLMLIAALVCASTLWSETPKASLRYGVQLAITLVTGIALAAVTPLRAWVRSVFVALFVICVICVAYGRRAMTSDGLVLIGILGSKNVMAMLAQVLLASALAALIDRKQPLPIRLAAPPAVLLSVYVLLDAHSAGGLVTAVLGVVLLIGFSALSLLDLRGRFILALAMMLMTVPVVVALPTLMGQVEDFSTTVLKKDPGLTGRDFLWAFADHLIADKPWLGHGFRAIWMGHSSTTIGLLRWSGQPDGRGFHFHDTYREWAVDFGLVGAAVIILIMGVSGLRLIRRGVVRPSAAQAFVVSLFLVSAVRAKVEAVFMPFAPTTLLLFCVLAMAWLPAAPPRRD